MTRRPLALLSFQLSILLVSFVLGTSNAQGLFQFLQGNNPIESKCFELKLTKEEVKQTDVGKVCVQFRDENQEYLVVTYDTSGTDYVLTSGALSYSPNPKGYPRDTSNNRPIPSDFEPQQQLEEAQNELSFEVKMDPRNFMTCPSDDVWTQYFVAYAKVRKADEGNDAALEAYADGGDLYAETGIEYCSYFMMKINCAPTPPPTPSPTPPPTPSPTTAAPIPNNDVKADAFEIDLTTPQPSSSPSSSPSTSPSSMPSVSPSLSPSVSPSAKITTTPPRSTTLQPATPEPSSAPSVAPSASPTAAPVVAASNAPSSSPTGTPAPSLLGGEDLVVGMSFIVITETSKAVHDLPHDMIQASFDGFARNIMADMHVPPLVPVGGGGATSQNKGRNLRSPYDKHDGQPRRKLWVKYDESTFNVYDFLVNTDCLNDELAQAVAKTSALRPPPAASQCHRAYARFGVRIADEDPTEVCNTLRNGTLAGYHQGRLQDAHAAQHPNSVVRLQPGDFEYCVPIDEFVVPDHGEGHWMDENPLANLTVVKEVEESNDKPWLIPLLIAFALLLLLLIIAAICSRRRGNKKHKRKEAKLANEEAALMSSKS